MAYRLEKEILTEFIKMYKELPCLWNPGHTFYSNKVSRNRAYDLLVKIYKALDVKADHSKVRKKIINIRTSYQRERHKVVRSQYHGNDLYVPSLWYYNLMTFLDELESKYTATTVLTVETTSDDGDDDKDPDNFPPAKRAKSSSSNEEESCKKELSYAGQNERSNDMFISSSSDTDLYARTISSQLNDLLPKQRFIAEKLISDVIFFGRLNKLKNGATLNLSDGDV